MFLIMIQRWRWRTLHPSVLQQAVHLCHLPQRAWVRGPDDHDDDHDADDYHDHDTITIMMTITMTITITIVIRLFTSTLDKSRVGATSMRFVWTSLASFLLDKSGRCFFTSQVWQVETDHASNINYEWASHLNPFESISKATQFLKTPTREVSQPDWIKINDKV